ncbi:MAG TPA: HEAT repeat domain-containing protein [Longimicrobiales bacterium]
MAQFRAEATRAGGARPSRSANTALALVALLSGAACGTVQAPASPTPLAVEQLPVQAAPDLADTDVALVAAVLRMEDRRVFEPDVVARALASQNPEVRRRAVLGAMRTGDSAAAGIALHALNDSVAAVRADAAFALGELGDTATTVVTALGQTLRDRIDVTAGEAAHALGMIGTRQSQAVLSAALRSAADPSAGSTARSPHVISELLLAVWRRPQALDHSVAELAQPFLTHPDSQVRFAAAYALMRAGGSAAVPVLLEATRDRDGDIRQTAVRALRASRVDSAAVRDAARAALISALRDADPHVRINAAQALGTFREPALTQPVAALLQDADRNVRLAAIIALDTLQTADAIALLQSVAGDTTEVLAIRAAALAGLVRTAPAAGIPVAQAWLRSQGWLQRLYGVRAVAAGEQDEVVALLRESLSDPDARVLGEAVATIAAADTTQATDALYVQALGSPDVIVRAGAISALGRHADPAHVSVLMDAYARARSDRENDAALAAVDAIARLARRDSAIARSFFFRFQRSPDPLVRAAVRRSLGAGSWGEPRPDSDRPLAFYENVVRALVQPAVRGRPPRAVIHSAGGDVTIELAAADAPLTVNNFIGLAEGGYFASGGFRWHRVVPNFVLQDGDPRGDGSGGPGYSIRDEMNRLRYTRGAVGMALSGPHTGGSQFFIAHSPQPHLDGGYTVFGYVRDSMTTADRVVQDEPINGIEILR